MKAGSAESKCWQYGCPTLTLIYGIIMFMKPLASKKTICLRLGCTQRKFL